NCWTNPRVRPTGRHVLSPVGLRQFEEADMGRTCPVCWAAVFASALIATPARGQTWDGSTSTDWNVASNWNTPATVPNSPKADGLLPGVALGSIDVSASFQVRSLTFTNPTGSYTLSSGVGQLSGLTSITVDPAVTGGTRTINLANVATGSLVFT